MHKLYNKGFTLIELLVVIAILGILAMVVLIAINPAERIAEANDTQVRSDIATIASAVEACFTATAHTTGGSYSSCDTITELTNNDYLKSEPRIYQQGNFDSTMVGNELLIGGKLQAARAESEGGCDPDEAYYVYSSADASSTIMCDVAWWSP